jgi:tRNA A37 threonylcarbamoyladenosine synthetase subunit TsaC/SUA5/YrdC
MPTALNKLFHIKARFLTSKLSFYLGTIQEIEDLQPGWSPLVWKILRLVWPGPVSIIVPKWPALRVKYPVIESVAFNRDDIALRIPDQDATILHHLLQKHGPMMITSANPSGGDDPTDVKDLDWLDGHDGDDEVVYKISKPTMRQQASTILDMRELIKTPGHLTKAQLRNLIEFKRIGCVPENLIHQFIDQAYSEFTSVAGHDRLRVAMSTQTESVDYHLDYHGKTRLDKQTRLMSCPKNGNKVNFGLTYLEDDSATMQQKGFTMQQKGFEIVLNMPTDALYELAERLPRDKIQHMLPNFNPNTVVFNIMGASDEGLLAVNKQMMENVAALVGRKMQPLFLNQKLEMEVVDAIFVETTGHDAYLPVQRMPNFLYRSDRPRTEHDPVANSSGPSSNAAPIFVAEVYVPLTPHVAAAPMYVLPRRENCGTNSTRANYEYDQATPEFVNVPEEQNAHKFHLTANMGIGMGYIYTGFDGRGRFGSSNPKQDNIKQCHDKGYAKWICSLRDVIAKNDDGCLSTPVVVARHNEELGVARWITYTVTVGVSQR